MAGLARRLAEGEGEDAGAAYLAGLLHDAGKFAGGRYHEDDEPEERASADAAEKILKKSGFGPRLVRRVTDALRALYREGKERNRLADIVHDADFLSKSGRLGVAQFFIKSTLRGQSLTRMAAESLSRELTYASALPKNMRTAAGRRLASSRSAETRRYYRGLLRELEEAQGIHFTTRRLTVDIPPMSPEKRSPGSQGKPAALGAAAFTVTLRDGKTPTPSTLGPRLRNQTSRKPASSGLTNDRKRRPGRVFRTVPVTLVHPRVCDRCGGRWRLAVSTERAVKCERLEARLVCAACGLERSVSFCLPEIAAKE